MKWPLKFSIALNLALFGGWMLIFSIQRTTPNSPDVSPIKADQNHAVRNSVSSSPTFRWQQLESPSNYRLYISNLRAAGCPESTIEDIVRGDIARAFSWKRSRLNIDGSGNGPWSHFREEQLLCSLLGVPATDAAPGEMVNPAVEDPHRRLALAHPSTAGSEIHRVPEGTDSTQNNEPFANASDPSLPLFMRNINWTALGFDDSQQAAIADAKQQFLNNIDNVRQKNFSSSDGKQKVDGPASATDSPSDFAHSQTVLNNIDDNLRAALGNDGYEAYLQQQYLNWYNPQVPAADANSETKNLTLNLGAFSISE